MNSVSGLRTHGLPRLLVAVTLSLTATACTHPLDEKGARALLQQSLESRSYSAPLSHIQPLMSPSNIDYSQASDSGDASVLKRLIEAGFVTQAASNETYPNIAGSWVADRSKYGGSVVETYKLELQMEPGSNRVFGGGESYSHGSGVGSGASIGTQEHPYTCSLSGTVRTDNTVSLQCGGPGIFSMGSAYLNLQYSQQPPRATLQESNLSFLGEAKPPITVKRYEYGFTPKAGVAGSNAPAGKIVVGSVTSLQLTTDTRATAQFGWTVSLNDLGRILFSTSAPSGNSTAVFAKKPDGSWVLAESPSI